MRKNSIIMIVLSIIIIGMIIPAGFSTNDNQVVLTYGETTKNNADYKNIVDSFFENQAHIDLKGVSSKIITASEVNKISSTITGKNYNSNQIFSSALVDLGDNENLKVTVDKSKITTITGDMYLSALKSAGITSGHVYVTSPVTATGESALAGIMNSYEVATDVEIPDTVKEAANNEIYTQAEIVKESNVSAVLCKENAHGYLEQVIGGNNVRRQEAEKLYEYNGAVYVINANAVKNKGLGGFTKIKKFVMSEENSVDIDTMLDWKFCEMLLSEKKLVI